MLRLALLEKEVLQDRLGKKGGSSGGNRDSGHLRIPGSLKFWSHGGGLS